MPVPEILVNSGLEITLESPDTSKQRSLSIDDNGELSLGGSLSYPVGYIDGCRLAFGSASTVTVGLAGESSVIAAGATTIKFSGVLAADITGSGAGGLDAGVEAGSKIYAAFVICDTNAALPPAVLLSLSGSPALPAGYDVSRRVGWVKNDSASDFVPFTQSGRGHSRKIWYDVKRLDTRVLNGGTATTFTSVDCSAFVPATATNVLFLAYFANGAAGSANDMLELRLPGSSILNPLFTFRSPAVSNSASRFQVSAMLLDQVIEYSVTDAVNNTVSLHIVNYEDEL